MSTTTTSFVLVSLILCSLTTSCHGITLSSLQRSLIVTTTSPTQGQVLNAGEDNITVTWSYNNTFAAGTDSSYKTIQIKFCYAPISQKDRPWRKTLEDLEKDKTCQFKIVTKPYSPSNNTFTGTIKKNVPSGSYFVRAYALNSADQQMAFGQTTDDHKTTNLLEIQAITGRHATLDIASICFSVFSVVSLFGFFFLEKRKAKAAQKK